MTIRPIGVFFFATAVIAAATAATAAEQGFAEMGGKLVRRCGTPDLGLSARKKIRMALEIFRGKNAWFTESQTPVDIPVHFHIIHDGASGKVSKKRIEAQIRVLNNAYEPHGFTFTMAAVNYHDKPKWYEMGHGSATEKAAKRTLRVEPKRNLNIYTAAPSDSLLGWATFPSKLRKNPKMDGVVLLHSTLPGGKKPFDQGDTGIHEVGHWLGLYHTFQEGCEALGDEIEDTPYEATPAYGIPEPERDTCPQPGLDPTKNFMDYGNDVHIDEFSTGQIRRIRDQVGTYRSDLLSKTVRKNIIQVIKDDDYGGGGATGTGGGGKGGWQPIQ